MAVISRTTCATDKLYTSLESLVIQLSESLSIKGVALLTNPPRLFEWKKFEFHLKGRDNFLERATPFIDKDSECWILGLSNEVYNISEFWVLFEKIAQNRRNLTQKIATGPILFCGSVGSYEAFAAKLA